MTSQADTRGIGRTRDRDLIATAWGVKQKEKKRRREGKKTKRMKGEEGERENEARNGRRARKTFEPVFRTRV